MNQIKEALMLNEQKKLRWKKLHDIIRKKQAEQYLDDYVFKTTFIRKIKKLIASGDLEKETVNRKCVFLYVPYGKQKKVISELRKERSHQYFDRFWDSLTLEQQKSMAIDLENMRQKAMKMLEDNITFLEDSIRKSNEDIDKVGVGYSSIDKKVKFHD
jgi:hypothetical protein